MRAAADVKQTLREGGVTKVNYCKSYDKPDDTYKSVIQKAVQ